MTAWSISRAFVLIGLIALVAVMDEMRARAQGPDELATLRAQVSQLFNQGKNADAVRKGRVSR